MTGVSGRLIDSSAAASSLRLEARGELNSVALEWEAQVPWSNQVQSAPYHYQDDHMVGLL